MKKTREQKIEYLKQYRIDNKERLTLLKKSKYEENKEQIKKYKEANKEKISLYNKKKAVKRKLVLIELLGGCCSVCKNKYPPYVYDLHHIDPATKEYKVNALYYRTWEKILNEAKKCSLVCANCHRIIHHKDKYDALAEDLEEEKTEGQ